jgi:phosphonate transport system substrate-binding protein
MTYRSLFAGIVAVCIVVLIPIQALALERTLAIVPQHGSISAARQWQPLINELSRQTGIRFRFVTAPSVTEFERRLLNGDYDYAYMNAALYLDAKSKQGFRALAQRQRSLRGVIIVRNDGPTRLSQLKAQTIAFPSPRALGATILVRNDLRQKTIHHNVAYLGTHESVYRAVARGQFVAGGGVSRSFNLLPQKLRSELHVLHTTRPSAGHVIAARNTVPRKESDLVRSALQSLHHYRAGKQALAGLYFEQLGPVDQKALARLANLVIPKRRQTREIVFHVIPRLDPESTRAQMQPLATYLMQRLEIQVKLETHTTMEAFEKAIYAEGLPSLINANPLQAVKLSRRGFKIIAQQLPVSSPEGMRGIVLTRPDNGIDSLSELAGKRVAFGGNRNAFFASVVPRRLLGQAGLSGKYNDVSRPGPVSDAIRRLHAGEIDAAGTGTMALHSKVLQAKYGVDKMKILAQSEAMPGLAWLLSPQIEPDLRREIRDLLLSYGRAAPGHDALRAGGIAGLRPANLDSYSIVGKYVEGHPGK